MRHVPVAAFALAVVVAGGGGAAQQSGRPGEPSGQARFRSTVTLVPVDVRVIDDKTGKPVTDLTENDFLILEDSVGQRIAHFSRQVFTPVTPAEVAEFPESIPGSTPTLGGLPLRETPLSLRPQPNRVFMIVLGRGRLQEPSKGLDALIDFVRTKLLPQDYVSVFAYDRATDFTTKHERVAEIVERFRKENDAINTHVGAELTGLAGIYGSTLLSKTARAKIDAVFDEAGSLTSRTLGSGENTSTGDRLAGDSRKAIDGALDELLGSNRVGAGVSESGAFAPPEMTSWAAFDAFVASNAQALQDLGNLYAAIGYMRHLDGEKHLVFVTEDGLLLPRAEDDEDLAAAASDARVAIDVLQTGGVASGMRSMMGRRALRGIADDTGGTMSTVEMSRLGLERIDERTLGGYLLGYYPSNTRWDGTFRRIVVKVTRPHTTVQFRHGYYARTDIPTFDRRFFVTRHRLQAAANYASKLTDIRLKLKASVKAEEGKHYASIAAQIDPSRIYFAVEKGMHVADLTVAVVGMDYDDHILGASVHRAVVTLDDESFEAAKKNWISWESRVVVPSGTRYLRLVIYDYFADLVGIAGVHVT